jgi:uncharacterized Tic20 family protein
MNSENQKGAKYHFLGLFFFIIPFVGLMIPFLIYAFRKYPSLDERNHIRTLGNFVMSYFLYLIALSFILPASVMEIVKIVFAVMGALMMIFAGMQARKGQDVQYPLALNIMKPIQAQKTFQ